MEKHLDRWLEEICTKPDVNGVLCSDQQGLCLGAKGVANHKSAGALAYLAHQAALLEPGKSPVIRLESGTSEVLIKSKEGISVAIFKSVQ